MRLTNPKNHFDPTILMKFGMTQFSGSGGLMFLVFKKERTWPIWRFKIHSNSWEKLPFQLNGDFRVV
jgi:hypothetical protein